MKTLLCLILALGSSAFAADAVIKVQSVPHAAASSPIAPGLIQGIAGIGQGVNGVGLPCMGCFGTPAGTVLVPPAYSVVHPLSQPLVIYYCVVETGAQGGTGTQTVDLVESSTGKVAQHATVPVTLPADSTNLIIFSTGGVPDNDGYTGAEELVFTTTVGTSTVQGRAYLWMLPQQ
jgi:hypothetical protein